MIYERKIYSKLKEYLSWNEIIVLTGMRRVGKTTLLKQFYNEIAEDNKLIFNMDNPIDQDVFIEKDYNNIVENFKYLGLNLKDKAYIFIDEIQNLPEIVKPLKYLYDEFNIKFFVTGSSSFYLKNLFPESLAGRKVIVELFPLDFEEFLIFKNSKQVFEDEFNLKSRNKNEFKFEKNKKFFEEYIEFGGFPQVVLAETKEKKQIVLKEIFGSYFEQDVKSLADFKNIGDLRNLILLLMRRVGTKLDISKIASILGISRPSVYSWLDFLEQTYFISRINQFSNNADNQLAGAKKVYLCDTGIINMLSQTDMGSILENAVFNNLRKYGRVQYFQNRHGSEIDFVLPELSTAFEVKTTAIPQYINKIKRLSEKLKLDNYYVISQNFYNDDHVIISSDI